MDVGELAIAVAIGLGIVALVWQGIVQNSRYDNVTQRLDGMYEHFDNIAKRFEDNTREQIQRSEERTREQMQRSEESLREQMQRSGESFREQMQRSEESFREQMQRSEETTREQIQRSEANATTQLEQAEQNHREDIRRLDAMAQVLGQRISDSEREQARLEGVNSVLQQQTHQHEPSPSD